MQNVNSPKVSVIVPVYNAEKYLEQCITSIMHQTLEEIEIICVDDGSTDNSSAILHKLQEQDSRIQVITQENGGAGAARNNGLQNARGEFLSFLDSDDFFEPTMLEKAVRAAEQYEADFVVFNSDEYFMNENRFAPTSWVLWTNDIPPYMPFSYRQLTGNVFKTFVGWAWDKLYRRNFVLSHNLWFQEQRTSNDLLFVFSGLVLAQKIVVVDEVLAHQRKGNRQSLSVTREKSWRCFYDALLALRQRLIDEDLYWELEKDYINYALHFSLWNLNTLAEPTQSLLKEQLFESWFSELGIEDKPREYFYNADEYAQYMRLQREYKHIHSNSPYKVSVILPIYNVAPYLRNCLDSVINQTLEELEIICVNDGSTDESLSIVQEYAQKDSRIVVITGPNGGYGKAMNKGLDRATGEYIGIVEPDDYVDVHMFSDLYEIAADNQLDFVKADFYRFTHDSEGRELLEYVYLDVRKKRYGQLLNPSQDPSCIRFTMNTWTGIYRRAFLDEYHIRHHETPGASFQDNGFYFQTFVYAQRAMIINKPYYRNRRDNPNSSVKNKAKVYCMNIEYDYIRDLLMQDREIWERFQYMYWWKKYHNYWFTYNRIDDSYKTEYKDRMFHEFSRAMELGQLSKEVFTGSEWNIILGKRSVGQTAARKEGHLLQRSIACYRDHGLLYTLKYSFKKICMKVNGGIQCCTDHGVMYTIKYAFKKLFRR